MLRLARYLARRLWWAALWLMRRPGMRAAQSYPLRFMNATNAAKAHRNLVRQNVFARRIGLPLLTFVVAACLITLSLQVIYALAVYLVESGVLRPRRPELEYPPV